MGDDDFVVDVDAAAATTPDDATPSVLQGIPGTPEALFTVGTAVHRLTVKRREGRGRYAITVDGIRVDAEALDERTSAIRRLASAVSGPRRPAPLLAPMAGLIVRVGVAVGQAVRAGEPLVVMEAMKMENELRAVGAGRVSAVRVAPGETVERGAVLVEMD